MKRSARPRRLALVLSALVLFLGAVAPNTVLCVGSGGHLAIETALAHCCDHPTSSKQARPSLGDSERCADDCSDTPLEIYDACSNTREAAPDLRVSPLVGNIALVLPERTTLRRSQSSGRTPADLTPRAQRTTVNLC